MPEYAGWILWSAGLLVICTLILFGPPLRVVQLVGVPALVIFVLGAYLVGVYS